MAADGGGQKSEGESKPGQPRRFSLRGLIAARVTRLATCAEFATRGWRWMLSALLLGLVPLILAYLLGTWLHQIVTAVLLTLIVLPLAWQDKWAKGIATIALTFVAHCV